MTGDDVRNPFVTPETAARYARGRPEFHLEVLDTIRELTGIRDPVPRGLDVGCGTGLSTRLVAELARSVVGLDVAAAMLVHAPRSVGHYVVAGGDRPPFADGTFDLVMVSSAFHWLDRDRFAAEMERVGRPGAWLVNVGNAFRAEMTGRPGFGPWFRSDYLDRWPPPPMLPHYREGEHVGAFAPMGAREYENTVAMDHDRLVTYLMSQSNVTMVIDAGRIDEAGARASIARDVAPFFAGDERADFLFGGWVFALRLP